MASESKLRRVEVELPFGKRLRTGLSLPPRMRTRLRVIAAALRRPGFLPATRLPSMNWAIA